MVINIDGFPIDKFRKLFMFYSFGFCLESYPTYVNQ